MDDHTLNLHTCSRCKLELPHTAEYFSKNKNMKYGLDSWCKACRREYALQGYWKNRDKRVVKMREYYAANREKLLPKIRERANKWYYANIERARIYRKKQYLSDQQSNIERTRRWAKNNPERRIINSRNSRIRRRARLLAAEGNFTDADVKVQFDSQKGRCWWCGKKLKGGYHADHLVPLARGGSNHPENIVVSCSPCNLSKGAKLPQEWNGRLL